MSPALTRRYDDIDRLACEDGFPGGGDVNKEGTRLEPSSGQPRWGRPFTACIAALAWSGLALQFGLSMQRMLADGRTLVEAVIWFFSFFTVLTNTIAATTLTVLSFKPWSSLGKTLARPVVQTGIAVSIAVVAIVYELLLRRLWHPQGLQFLADLILHDAIPVLYVLHWLLFVSRGGLAWRDIGWWLGYPAAYLVYVLIHGALTARYPYPFLDAGVLGYERMLASVALILGGFLLVAAMFVAADRWAASARPGRAAGGDNRQEGSLS